MGDMLKRLSVFVVTLVAGATALGGEVMAQQYLADPWQMGFQEPRSPSAEQIFAFHDLLLYIEVAIVIFVLGIMGYIIVKFNSKANPTPSKTTHNTLLEVVWTVVPIIILVVIAVPSLKLLYFTDRTYTPELTIKVTGNQWYWSYTYPDNNDIEFDSIYVSDDELEEGQPRMLTVDNPLVLPVDTNIRILLASNDVIHNFAMPSLGLKLDTTPGRANETWVSINDEGTYYGMCSELCGVNHGFMPVQIEAVSKEAFNEWLVGAEEEFGSNESLSDKVVKFAAALGQ
ncbi:MAG: cytochrome c oxidase subunit II [Rhodospirillaceae bacterium]|nr:cytochrome c oxidase subunit II [Rhodospirillaceae bacterium]